MREIKKKKIDSKPLFKTAYKYCLAKHHVIIRCINFVCFTEIALKGNEIFLFENKIKEFCKHLSAHNFICRT